MNIRDALKKYFGRYEDTDEDIPETKKKKKKKLRAGSYMKGARKGYEEALEEISDY